MKALSAMKLCQINVTGEKEKSQRNNDGVYKLYTELEGFSCSCKSSLWNYRTHGTGISSFYKGLDYKASGKTEYTICSAIQFVKTWI